MRLDAVLIALVALAWLPANHYYPWASAWQEGLALLFLCTGIALWSRNVRLPLVWAAFVALALGSVAVQTLASQILFAGDSWIVAVYLFGFGLALMAGDGLVEHGTGGGSSRSLELLCAALLVAALVSAGIGFAQWAGVQRLGIFGADLKPGARPFANFGQPNHWCTASLIGLGCAWVLFEARRLGGLAFGLVAAVLLLAMVVSGSRTAWLQLGFGFLLLLYLRRQVPLRLPLGAASAALAAAAMAWVLWPWLNTSADPGIARSVVEQAQAGVRLPLWQALLGAIAERPWTGYGWNQMVLAQQAVALDGPPLHRHFEHAHNLLLDLLIWAGVPVGLTLAGLAAWALLRTLRSTRDPRAAGLLLAAGGVLAHSMVEFPVEYAYFLLPMGLMLGAAHRLSSTPQRSLAVPAVGMRAAGVAMLAALAFTGLDYLEAEQNHRMLRLESARIGTTRVESPPPQLRVLTQLESFLTFARQQPKAGASAKEMQAVHRVAARFAYPPTQYRLAQWQALNGDTSGAERTLQLLCAMHPADHCRDVIQGWTALQAQQPALLPVPAPTLPR
jgi:Virulence factor membrane-bound polymerase, C-terminal/O-Antigen ligase